jgi:peptidoglycan hydrolase CwlO-like protein
MVQERAIQDLQHLQNDLLMAEHQVKSLEDRNHDLQTQIEGLQQQIGDFLLQKRELMRLQNVLESRDRDVEDLRRKLT